MVAPVVNMPSSKHSGVSGVDTCLFVQHSAESPLRGGYAQSLTNWANTPLEQGGPQASWPSFVDPIARVRMVAWPNSAWTQGWANSFGVGLECAGYARFSKAEWLTGPGLKQLENLAHEWVYYWKLEQAAGNTIELRWLTTAEVQKVMAGNRSIKGFCTHAQIDPNSRTDPGPNFPYDRLMNRIKEIIGGKVATAAASKPTSTLDPLEKIMSWYKDKAEFEAAMRKLPNAYRNEEQDKRDVYGRQTQMPQDVGRYLLNYDNTTRSDRSLYALWIDAGLNSTAARELCGKILEEQAAQRAQIETLVGTIAALAGGAHLDIGQLTREVQQASEAGVKRAIESIRTTVVIDAPNETAPESEPVATLEEAK